MTDTSEVHELLIARLTSRAMLDEEDQEAVRRLSIHLRGYRPHARIVREGDRPNTCGFIVSGFACRTKMTATGERQIVALLMPGDLINLQQIVLPRADHDVQALTSMQVGDIASTHLQELAQDRASIGRALWIDTLIEGSIVRELLLNNGRRDALQRLAHQLCEFAHRLAMSVGPSLSFDLPLTQEQLGDMTAMTGIHVNRTLKKLRDLGIITRTGRTFVINDWQALARQAMFTPNYLHLDAIGAASARAAHDAFSGFGVRWAPGAVLRRTVPAIKNDQA